MKDVKLVEIEIHSFCNRRCPWCPNSLIDRSFYRTLPFDVYHRLIRDLKKSKYTGRFSFSRYNEPLSVPDLLSKYIQLIKDKGLEGEIVFNTNGDYLDFEVLSGIAVDDLTVMDYDCRGSEYYKDLLFQNDVDVEFEDEKYIYGKWMGKKILVCLNWPENVSIVDRGGILRSSSTFVKQNKPERRSEPCFEPSHFIGIDYNGSVTPCCNIRSDYTGHQEYILGNIRDSSIRDIFHSERAETFRKLLSSAASKEYPKEYPKPCTYCSKEPGRYTRDIPGIFYSRQSR